LQTMNPSGARPESRTRRRRLVAAAACIAVALAAALGVKLFLDHRIPSPGADAGRLSRYMASPAFAALPDAQKTPYMDAFRRAADRGELTPEQQRLVINNVDNRGGKNPIRQYLSLPPGKERERFLDDIIDRVLEHEKHRPRQDQKGPREAPHDVGRLADSIPPEERAQMNKFLQDLHDRRLARGIPDDGKFLFNLSH
jgi:hypothetical protein